MKVKMSPQKLLNLIMPEIDSQSNMNKDQVNHYVAYQK